MAQGQVVAVAGQRLLAEAADVRTRVSRAAGGGTLSGSHFVAVRVESSSWELPQAAVLGSWFLVDRLQIPCFHKYKNIYVGKRNRCQYLNYFPLPEESLLADLANGLSAEIGR